MDTVQETRDYLLALEMATERLDDLYIAMEAHPIEGDIQHASAISKASISAIIGIPSVALEGRVTDFFKMIFRSIINFFKRIKDKIKEFATYLYKSFTAMWNSFFQKQRIEAVDSKIQATYETVKTNTIPMSPKLIEKYKNSKVHTHTTYIQNSPDVVDVDAVMELHKWCNSLEFHKTLHVVYAGFVMDINDVTDAAMQQIVNYDIWIVESLARKLNTAVHVFNDGIRNALHLSDKPVYVPTNLRKKDNEWYSTQIFPGGYVFLYGGPSNSVHKLSLVDGAAARNVIRSAPLIGSARFNVLCNAIKPLEEIFETYKKADIFSSLDDTIRVMDKLNSRIGAIPDDVDVNNPAYKLLRRVVKEISLASTLSNVIQTKIASHVANTVKGHIQLTDMILEAIKENNL